VVSVPRETEGKEKDEGSLSVLIVPLESREIGTRLKPAIRKGAHRESELRFRNI